MKFLFKSFLSLATVCIMAACSADSISSADEENWPADFTASEYAKVNYDLVTIQMKLAIADSNAAKKKSVSDMDKKEIDLFFDSEESVKKIFTAYQGFNDSIWPGYEKLKDGLIYVDFRTPLYNFHIFGNTATQDVKYLEAFKPNDELLKMQYIMVGKIEGRPYRYCKNGETKKLQSADESQAVAVASKWDFSAHLYCKSKTDDQIYMIR